MTAVTGMADHRPVDMDALVELARSASEDAPSRVLEVVASTIQRTAGYKTVVLNVFRPEWDHFETVQVIGDQKSRDALLGMTEPRETILRLLTEADDRAKQVYFFKEGLAAAWDDVTSVYVPDLPEPTSPEQWNPNDALLAMLRDSAGRPLGFLSIDEPLSGLRPKQADLNLLQIICAFAEQALRAARRAADAETDNRLQAEMTAISPMISACATLDELDSVVLDVIIHHFGFARAAIYQRVADDLVVNLCSGWGPDGAPSLPGGWSRIAEMADQPSQDRVIAATRLFGDGSPAAQSSFNGRGPLAWSDHCLILPWRDEPREQSGVVVLQDPSDRLRPLRERQSTIQLLVDLAASVAGGIAQREALARLASHDALTGVRNRRGLEGLIAERSEVSVLLCDLDHFKSINDAFGHDIGDEVLAAFGGLLRDCSADDDVPLRLGGEEFCIVLGHADASAAAAIAERLRAATELELSTIVGRSVTVSIGIAIGTADAFDARSLLRSADRALYEAKRSGRNRVFLWEGDPAVRMT
jgi:diguanylate cyclase (GGDEF)-like protein